MGEKKKRIPEKKRELQNGNKARKESNKTDRMGGDGTKKKAGAEPTVEDIQDGSGNG